MTTKTVKLDNILWVLCIGGMSVLIDIVVMWSLNAASGIASMKPSAHANPIRIESSPRPRYHPMLAL